MSAPEPAGARPPGSRHPLVDRILGGGVAESVRLTAARGALPLPLQDLIYLQIHLLRDESPAVVQAAMQSLGAVPIETLLPLFQDPCCDPGVLDHFARSGRLTGDALATVISHPVVSEATLEAVAASGSTEALHLIVTNETRVIANPEILNLLRANQNLGAPERRRLNELERDFIGKERLEVREAVEPAAEVPEVAAAPEFPADQPPVEESQPAAGSGEQPSPEGTPETAPAIAEDPSRTPAFQRILQMNVGDRIQLAMKGNAEERAVLVRDTAKVVALQVLKSPKLSENEIASFASMRNIHEDVLRIIAGNRDWTKSYSVMHTLLRNPKTPPGLSVKFLPRLGTRDLKGLSGDKNIPEMVRRQAKNLFQARTQRPVKKLGKKGH